MINLGGIRGWVFDIDDTLYLERDYVVSGFEAVGRWLAEVQGIQGFGEAAIARFESGARRNTFNLALADMGRPNEPELVGEMVKQYRMHAPKIALADDAQTLLSRLVDFRSIAVISDGPLDSQSRKAEALALTSIARPILLTDRWGPEFSKPHERAFCEVEAALGLAGDQLVYVADNPTEGFSGAPCARVADNPYPAAGRTVFEYGHPYRSCFPGNRILFGLVRVVCVRAHECQGCAGTPARAETPAPIHGQGSSFGADVTVGVGAIVVENVRNGVLVVGVPEREIACL